MRVYAAVTSAIVLALAGTAPAFARNSATLRLVAYVPVRCDAAPVTAFINDDVLVINVRRNCNTGHAIVVTGRDVEGLGQVTITETGTGRTIAGTSAVFGQAEAYVDDVEQFVVTARDASPEALLQYGHSMMIGVQVS